MLFMNYFEVGPTYCPCIRFALCVVKILLSFYNITKQTLILHYIHIFLLLLNVTSINM